MGHCYPPSRTYSQLFTAAQSTRHHKIKGIVNATTGGGRGVVPMQEDAGGRPLAWGSWLGRRDAVQRFITQAPGSAGKVTVGPTCVRLEVKRWRANSPALSHPLAIYLLQARGTLLRTLLLAAVGLLSRKCGRWIITNASLSPCPQASTCRLSLCHENVILPVSGSLY